MSEQAAPYRTGVERTSRIVVTTAPDVSGYSVIEYLGVVRGIVVRSPSIGQGLLGSLKSIGGGNIQEFVDVCEAARHDAYGQMVQHAEALGAHAIIAMRYDATEFMQGATEVLAYGTAVRLERR
ncbi:MAG: YbjQ family protein [Deltaproteobacteria bacterium]|nr:YbjQ family protein [Deltaproteobacteria bacterium]